MPATTTSVEKARAWCMVIDMKRCDGCVTLDVPPQCTQACIAGHFVPKGQEWIKIYTQQLPGGGTYFQPTPCYQCENAPCVNVCPVGATYQDKTGVVLIDHDRCIGCRMCMAACPYQRRFFNWGKPQIPPEAFSEKYSPLNEGPAVKGTVIKCSFCAHLLADGKLPNCVTGCPQKALYMGDLNGDIASNGGVVVKLSEFLDENSAYRYKQDLGTQPRVFYLPGYGQEIGRKPDDPRKLKPAVWSWGGEGYNQKIGIWPWGETPK
jgi:molybdopterin-containing oxidoreductase family iron-sulfur binding subunit